MLSIPTLSLTFNSVGLQGEQEMLDLQSALDAIWQLKLGEQKASCHEQEECHDATLPMQSSTLALPELRSGPMLDTARGVDAAHDCTQAIAEAEPSVLDGAEDACEQGEGEADEVALMRSHMQQQIEDMQVCCLTSSLCPV